MKFCPNCGFKLEHQRGAFCPECGQKLPALVEKSYPGNFEIKDGWTIMAETAERMDFTSIEMPDVSVSRGGTSQFKCDFRKDDFDSLFTCFEGIEMYLRHVAENHEYKIISPLVEEFNDNIERYFSMLSQHLKSTQKEYPPAFTPFLIKTRQYFSNAISALYNTMPEEYESNVKIFRLYINAINVVNGGDYRRRHLYGEYYDELVEEVSPGQSGQNVDNQSMNANLDAPDFKDKIEELENDLGNHKPSISITEYDETIDYAKKLEELIGLSKVKEQLKQYIDNIKLQLVRQKEHPELTIAVSYNCIFKGKPGTGKTTVARIMAGLLRQAGIIKSGRLVEVDASNLVSGWIGFSPKITAYSAYKAMDGVLFIDEAYSLMNNFKNSSGAGPGKEVIDTLTPIMENNRERLIVIMAGYDKEMDAFLKASNTGFPSRFKVSMQFEDYNADEMTEIFKDLAERDYYEIGTRELDVVHTIFEHIYKQIAHIPTFANARTVRNLFDQVKRKASQRMISNPNSDKDTILIEDVQLSPEEIKSALGIF